MTVYIGDVSFSKRDMLKILCGLVSFLALDFGISYLVLYSGVVTLRHPPIEMPFLLVPIASAYLNWWMMLIGGASFLGAILLTKFIFKHLTHKGSG